MRRIERDPDRPDRIEDARRDEQRTPRPVEAIADECHEDRRDDRDGVDHEQELTGAGVRPAVLGERVGQPGRVAVVDEGRRREERDEQPRHRPPQREMRTPADGTRPAAARGRDPPHERRGGREREDEHRRPPGTAGIGKRNREPGGDRRADLDATRVQARDEHRTIREALLDGHDHERVAEAHADADGNRQRDHGERARQDRAPDAAAGDQGERDRDRADGADARGERRRGGREHAHADHGDGAQQRRHRVADAERVLRPRQHRAEPDELGSQAQRCERDRYEQTDAAAQRPAGHRSSYRGFRFSTNAETPSAKSCVPRSNP